HPGARAARAAQRPAGSRGRGRARPAGRLSAGGERQECGGAPPRHDRCRGGEPAGHRHRSHRRGVDRRERPAEGRAGPAGHPRARGPARAGGPSLASGEEGGAVISKFFIEHPIFANVIALVTVIVGGVFLYGLPVAQYPEIVPPTIQVSTRYPGASAEVVASTIGVPMEQAINGVENSIYMSSTSASDGSYTLTITFEVGTDLDTSLALVQNRVNTALAQLPGGVTAQGVTILKVSPNILLVASLYSENDRYDETFFSNYAIINLQNPLARIQGVGQIRIFGAGPYSMRVWLDPKRLQTFRITTRARARSPARPPPPARAPPGGERGGGGGAGPPPPPPVPENQPFQFTINAL